MKIDINPMGKRYGEYYADPKGACNYMLTADDLQNPEKLIFLFRCLLDEFWGHSPDRHEQDFSCKLPFDYVWHRFSEQLREAYRPVEREFRAVLAIFYLLDNDLLVCDDASNLELFAY